MEDKKTNSNFLFFFLIFVIITVVIVWFAVYIGYSKDIAKENEANKPQSNTTARNTDIENDSAVEDNSAIEGDSSVKNDKLIQNRSTDHETTTLEVEL